MKQGLVLLIAMVLGLGLVNGKPKPNIILMMADDMGLGDTSAYQFMNDNSDESQVHTPSMERLAKMGLAFSDAHSASSRCTASRYGILTGRYPWRTRLKHYVLFGSQGDPLIEADRPTLATLCASEGYHTGIIGKWHVGLRYHKSDGTPAAGFLDADITQPLHTSPMDHGFHFVRTTSRSHPTSGPSTSKPKKNTPEQNVGPGHIEGRRSVSASGKGRELLMSGANAYDLDDLGRRNSNNTIAFMKEHITGAERAGQPFFLYYPVPSNHTPHTPCDEIAGIKIKGASKNKAGQSMGTREDFIWENDVALGRLLDFLEKHDDPRNPGYKLIDNTIVIFTSDNGAEKDHQRATGPFKSNKGSCYEGGHRVPFMMAWKGQLPENQVSDLPVIGTDLFATFSAIFKKALPDLTKGEKGAEDSFDILSRWEKGAAESTRPLFHNDHKEASKVDPAILAMKVINPLVGNGMMRGEWKVFFKPTLLRSGKAEAMELYNLSKDPAETTNLIENPEYKSLLESLCRRAEKERSIGAQRLYKNSKPSIEWTFSDTQKLHGDNWASTKSNVSMKIVASSKIVVGLEGLGVLGAHKHLVDSGESIKISFDCDVVVESVALKAGKKGSCGGFFTMGKKAALQIYCVDADNDSKEQFSEISDFGVLKKGEVLVFETDSYLNAEPKGAWSLQKIKVSCL